MGAAAFIQSYSKGKKKRALTLCQTPPKLQPGAKGCWLVTVALCAKSCEIALERRGRTREG